MRRLLLAALAAATFATLLPVSAAAQDTNKGAVAARVAPEGCRPAFDGEVTWYRDPDGTVTFDYYVDREEYPEADNYTLLFSVGLPGFEPGVVSTGYIAGFSSRLRGGRVRTTFQPQFNLGLVPGRDYNYLLEWSCDFGSGYVGDRLPVVFDDVNDPPCTYRPRYELWDFTDTTATFLLGNDADYQINGFGSEWTFEIGPSGFSPGTVETSETRTGAVAVAPTYEVFAVSPGTDYDYYVRGTCPDGEASEWFGPRSFTTSGDDGTDPPVTEDPITYVSCGGVDNIRLMREIFVTGEGDFRFTLTTDEETVSLVEGGSVRYGVGGERYDPDANTFEYRGGGLDYFNAGVFRGSVANLSVGADYYLWYQFTCPGSADPEAWVRVPFTATVTEAEGCALDLEVTSETSDLDDPAGIYLRYALTEEAYATATGYTAQIVFVEAGADPGDFHNWRFSSDRQVSGRFLAERFENTVPGQAYDHYIRFECPDGTDGEWTGLGQATAPGEPEAPACDLDLELTFESFPREDPDFAYVRYALSEASLETADGYRATIEIGPEGFTPGTGTAALVSERRLSTIRFIAARLDDVTAGATYDHYIRFDCPDGTEGEWTGFGQIVMPDAPEPPAEACGAELALETFVRTDGTFTFTLDAGDENAALIDGASVRFEVGGDRFDPNQNVFEYEGGGLQYFYNGLMRGSVADVPLGGEFFLWYQVACPGEEAGPWTIVPFSMEPTPQEGCPLDLDYTFESRTLEDPAGVYVRYTLTEEAAATASGYTAVVEIGPAGFTPGSGTAVEVSERQVGIRFLSVRVDSLPEATAYDHYIRFECPDGTTSEWSGFGQVTSGGEPEEPTVECGPDLPLTREIFVRPDGDLAFTLDAGEENADLVDGTYVQFAVGTPVFDPEKGYKGWVDAGGGYFYAELFRGSLQELIIGEDYLLWYRLTCSGGQASEWVSVPFRADVTEPEACPLDIEFGQESLWVENPDGIYVSYGLTPTSVELANGYGVEIELGTAGFTPGTGTSVERSVRQVGNRWIAERFVGLDAGATYDHYIRFSCPNGTTGEWTGFGQVTTPGGPIDPPVDFNDLTELLIGDDGWSQREVGRLDDIRNGGPICGTDANRGAWYFFEGDGSLMTVLAAGGVNGDAEASSRLWGTVLKQDGDGLGPVVACSSTGAIANGARESLYDFIQTEAGARYYLYVRSTRRLPAAAIRGSRYAVRVRGLATEQAASVAGANAVEGALAADFDTDAALGLLGDEEAAPATEAAAVTPTAAAPAPTAPFSLVEVSGDDAATLFPNPAKTAATLERADATHAATATLFDGAGREALRLQLDPGQYRMRLDLTGLPAGTYVLEVANEVGRVTAAPLVVR